MEDKAKKMAVEAEKKARDAANLQKEVGIAVNKCKFNSLVIQLWSLRAWLTNFIGPLWRISFLLQLNPLTLPSFDLLHPPSSFSSLLHPHISLAWGSQKASGRGNEAAAAEADHTPSAPCCWRSHWWPGREPGKWEIKCNLVASGRSLWAAEGSEGVFNFLYYLCWHWNVYHTVGFKT